jgi:hypothetical protein
VGYNESFKAYRIYIPEQHKVEVSRDITFNEKMAFNKSIEKTIEEEEYEEYKEEITCLPESQNEEIEQLDHTMQPCEPIESVIVPKTKKHPTWIEATLQEAKRLKHLSGTFKKRKKPQKILQLCNMYDKYSK